MIPSRSLLIWFSLTVIPGTILIGLFPKSAMIGWLLLFAFILSTSLDAFLAQTRRIPVDIETAKVARLARKKEGTIDFSMTNAAQRNTRFRLAVPLPGDFDVPSEILDVELDANAQEHTVSLPCTPRERGRFDISHIHLESDSPLRLWNLRSSRPIECQIRVHPNLLDEKNAASALFLNRGAFGAQAMRQVGKGRDFEKLREYVPGDSFDEIDWKATARKRRPITKVFQVERTQEVYVVLDASRLSAVPQESTGGNPGDKTPIIEKFITAGLTLGLAAEQQGDHFGMITFQDQVTSFVKAKNGQSHFHAVRDSLLSVKPRLVSPDFQELATFLRVRLRRRALLIVLTSLEDPVLAESFTKSMELLNRQHLIFVNVIQPPDGKQILSADAPDNLEEAYQQLAGHLRWKGLRNLQSSLKCQGIDTAFLENEKMAHQLITQYMAVKRRQLL